MWLLELSVTLMSLCTVQLQDRKASALFVCAEARQQRYWNSIQDRSHVQTQHVTFHAMNSDIRKNPAWFPSFFSFFALYSMFQPKIKELPTLVTSMPNWRWLQTSSWQLPIFESVLFKTFLYLTGGGGGEATLKSAPYTPGG